MLVFEYLTMVSAMATARHQSAFAEDTACRDWTLIYTATSTADVDESFGDHGWISFDENLCTVGTGCN